jgi:hypothetical protein
MFLRNRWHVSIAILIATIAAEPTRAADEPFQWTHVGIPRVAFYEHAPRSIVALMRAAVKEECTRPSPHATANSAAENARAIAAQQTTRTQSALLH